jgi:hypothetical protein
LTVILEHVSSLPEGRLLRFPDRFGTLRTAKVGTSAEPLKNPFRKQNKRYANWL